MFDCIRFSGYKSFLQEETEISHIGYLNLFIGKNNSGKSSALDMVGASCCADARHKLSIKPASLCTGYLINEDSINAAFIHEGYSNFAATRNAKNHLGEYFWVEPKIRIGYGDSPATFAFDYDRQINASLQGSGVNWNDYFRVLQTEDSCYLKISAERNIVPEIASQGILQPDGTGATDLIRRIVNHRQFDEQLIEVNLLSALNEIMGNDAHFESIRVQEISGINNESNSKWEVFLQERGCPRFPLSQSGSGLKTIILVLLNLIVLPSIKPGQTYVYGFEELENNLHPALQRRLYEFIYTYATENKTPIFLTTHSHVAINMLFEKEGVSLYHVTKSGHSSIIKRIENYVDRIEILDDLDVKASDLLQANGVIWVEGPSDRIYVKRWLEVFGGADISEGVDYQFAYYGGRLLSHYSAVEDCDNLINILLINRNSAIIIDSDKRYRSAPINDTKKRIQQEFESKSLFSWITKGKEIENYLTVNAINLAIDSKLSKQCGQFELFPKYIEDAYKGFSSKKVPFANIVKEHISDESILDLESQVKRLYQTIKLWNK